MEVIDKRDLLKLNDDTFVRSILAPQEEVYLSCALQKYNRFGLKQQRTLLITNMHLFNLTKQKINRKIDLFKVDGFTISEDSTSSEFIIHISGEYDYRYQSMNLRDVIFATIRKILRNKGHLILFYKVPSTKLKPYATIKKEVPKGIFRRPEKIYVIEEKNLDIIEKQVEDSVRNNANWFEETKMSDSEKRKQTINQQSKQQNEAQSTQQNSEEFETSQNSSKSKGKDKKQSKEEAKLQEIPSQKQTVKTNQYQAKSYEIQDSQEVNLKLQTNVPELEDFQANFKVAETNGAQVLISEITDVNAFSLSHQQIDAFNESQHVTKIVQVVEKRGDIDQIILEKPPQGFTPLTQILQRRASQLKRFDELEIVDNSVLAQIFGNVVKAVQDLEDRNLRIQKLQPENILINENSKQVKIIFTESAFQDLKKAGDSTYSYLIPTVEDIKYQSPEMLEHKLQNITGCSWAIGLMMYEYQYGFHPFAHKDSKVMQMLIKRYPVIFPEEPITTHDFQEVISDLLTKDYQQRIGSENLQREIFQNQYFSQNYER